MCNDEKAIRLLLEALGLVGFERFNVIAAAIGNLNFVKSIKNLNGTGIQDQAAAKRVLGPTEA